MYVAKIDGIAVAINAITDIDVNLPDFGYNNLAGIQYVSLNFLSLVVQGVDIIDRSLIDVCCHPHFLVSLVLVLF